MWDEHDPETFGAYLRKVEQAEDAKDEISMWTIVYIFAAFFAAAGAGIDELLRWALS